MKFSTVTVITPAIRLSTRAFCFVGAALALALNGPRLSANTGDFNSNPGDISFGKADLLFLNKTTRLLTVWFMNGSSFVRAKQITLNGQPFAVDPNWKVVGVGKFGPSPNFPSDPPPPTILWQHVVDRTMAVWWLKSDGTGDRTALDTTAAVAGGVSPTGWQSVAVGDFNGDGKSDIAFQHDSQGTGAIWLMNGLSISQNAAYGNGPNWRITGAGDFGNWQTRTTGVKDTKDDILLTYYDPANDSIGVNLAGIWFMDGLTRDGSITLQNSSGQNMVPNLPDWRLVGTGDYDLNGKADVFIRDAVIGRHPIWHLSGHIFQSGAFVKPEPDPALKLFSQDWLQSTWRHKDIYPSINALASSTSPVQFTITFRIAPFQSSGVTIRRRVAEGSWISLVTGYTLNTFTDTGAINGPLQAGPRYEYEVFREGSWNANLLEFYPARVFACVNQPVSAMENRGKVIVIVDGNVTSGISTGLRTFTNDLIGDGWSVALKTDAPRHDNRSVNCGNGDKSDPLANAVNITGRNTVKLFIDQHPDAKGVILVGHVTVPYSGSYAPDSHGQHTGAWVADIWYGHSGIGWTDITNHLGTACVTFPANSNVGNPSPDGKFDQDFVPSPQTELTKFVGRIDFARLSSFGTGDAATQTEKNLLNQYFTKNHAYRIKATLLDNRAIVLSTFDLTGYKNDTAQNALTYEHAFRNMSPLFGSGFDKIIVGDPFNQKTDSYLWGILAGEGGGSSISQNQPGGPPQEGPFLYHTTQDLLTNEGKIGFYLLLGSYFGDWNSFDNDFLRATIATRTNGLAVGWIAPNPIPQDSHWQLQGLALGDPLGQGLLQTIKHGIPHTSDQSRVLSILGDPTLRMGVLAPPKSVTYNGNQLSWQAPDLESGWQYYVYSASSMQGPFSAASGSPTSSTSITVSNPGVLMVRAARAVTTGSATFTNFSQGTYFPANP